MKLGKLHLRNFRNITEQTLSLQPGLNIFRGQNGQGKTNLIEAVHLLTHGKSFRTSDNSALIHHGDFQSTRVVTIIERKDLQSEVEFKIRNNKKQISTNGKRVSSAYLKSQFPSVLFSPESLMVVKDSAQKRRELVDDLAIGLNPAIGKLYNECRRLLRQRNALLKQIKEQQIDDSKGARLLDSISQLFITKSARFIATRLETMEKIGGLLQIELCHILSNTEDRIEMDYLISGQGANGFSEDEIANALYKRWSELRHNECQLGQSLVGPHKHDIKFHFNGKDARYFCSQGQQRAIILAFKMAHIRLHYAVHEVFPLLLLDDVLSELDRENRRDLWIT